MSKPTNLLTSVFTRRTMLTRVVPVSLAATLLGAEASTASAQTFQPMSFATNVAPGAAAYRNYTMVVATGTDGRIFYNWWTLGGGGHGWVELDGNGGTDAAPAASFVVKGDIGLEIDMWAAVKGLDDNIYVNVGGGFGNPFAGWQQLPGLQTTVAPAATVSNTTVDPVGALLPTVVATSTDNRIFYNNTQATNGWVELDGNGGTDASPAAALVGGNYLFVIVKGLDGQLYLNQGTLGGTFVGWQPLNFSTTVAPGATSSGNTSVTVATSTNGNVYYNWWVLGGGGNGWVNLGGQTNTAPAAALVGGNYLFVIVRGLDGNLYLNQGTLGGTFVGWLPLS